MSRSVGEFENQAFSVVSDNVVFGICGETSLEEAQVTGRQLKAKPSDT